MSYSGYLLKVGTSKVQIPDNLILSDKYLVTPQRLVLSAPRDVTGVSHPEVYANQPPIIEFTTPRITNVELAALNTILANAYTDANARLLPITYYNPDFDRYDTAICRQENIQHRILRRTNTTVYYGELRFVFTGV